MVLDGASRIPWGFLGGGFGVSVNQILKNILGFLTEFSVVLTFVLMVFRRVTGSSDLRKVDEIPWRDSRGPS